jgi:nucleoid-associated protein YgaU
MARKTKEEAERTRQQIIHAARQVFHECGVSRTSLEKIAKAHGTTIPDLMKLNRIKDPKKLQIGQQLTLPPEPPKK